MRKPAFNHSIVRPVLSHSSEPVVVTAAVSTTRTSILATVLVLIRSKPDDWALRGSILAAKAIVRVLFAGILAILTTWKSL